MEWDTIAASEVDANSPLNQTLFGKIRGNINFLAGNSVLFSGDYPAFCDIPNDGNWRDVKTCEIYVPPFTGVVIQVNVESCFVPGGVTSRQAKVVISNGSGGWNESGVFFPGDGLYNFVKVDVPNTGGFAGTGGWREAIVQMRHTDAGGNKNGWVKNIVYKVKSIS